MLTKCAVQYVDGDALVSERPSAHLATFGLPGNPLMGEPAKGTIRQHAAPHPVQRPPGKRADATLLALTDRIKHDVKDGR